MSEQMKTKITLAAIILTYNEEQNIKDCIESVQFANEIVVIDSGSCDETVTIAKNCGAQVVVNPMGSDGFAGQRNLALAATDADWLLYVDADERMTREAAVEIKQILVEHKPCAWKIKRMNIVFGQMMQHGEHGPDYVVRLFPRNSVNWVGIVHEHPEFKLPVQYMKAVMHHYTYTNWNRYFIKFNQYTTMMADKMQERGKKAYLSDLIIRPWFAFFRFYILKLGFLDGKMGFVFAVFHGFYTFSKYVKLYYWQGKQVGK
jgi:glycosyltransferase involved in cell wall biosynthesis